MKNQLIEDIIVTALEGGSNYWYLIQDKDIEKVRKIVPRSEEDCISIAISKFIQKGHELPIYDIESPEDQLGILSLKNIETGNLKLQSDGRDELDNLEDEPADADVADIIFQYWVLGEIIFG